jgi:hypothetical protein
VTPCHQPWLLVNGYILDILIYCSKLVNCRTDDFTILHDNNKELKPILMIKKM